MYGQANVPLAPKWVHTAHRSHLDVISLLHPSPGPDWLCLPADTDAGSQVDVHVGLPPGLWPNTRRTHPLRRDDLWWCPVRPLLSSSRVGLLRSRRSCTRGHALVAPCNRAAAPRAGETAPHPRSARAGAPAPQAPITEPAPGGVGGEVGAAALRHPSCRAYSVPPL